MPGCNQILTGIAKDCAPNMGGIKLLLLCLFSSIASVTIDETTGKITAITFEDDAPKFEKFALPKGVASLGSSLQVNTENGVNYVQNLLTLAFNRMDTAKRVAISALSVSECVAIVQDNNGKYWYVGKDEPLTANGGDSGTGAAKTDRNGYGLNMQSEEQSYPYEVNIGSESGQIDIDSLLEGEEDPAEPADPADPAEQ